ncbi:MAG: hypothetical protein WA803_06745, partial [Steroidobacteraceae bacterium]
MPLRLLQVLRPSGERLVAATDGSTGWRVNGAKTVLSLAENAMASKSTLTAVIEAAGRGEDIDLTDALKSGSILAPVDHPDSARVF